MSDRNLEIPRPTAPHLQIYRWPITMAMSIAHRITGGALYFGTLFLTAWLVSLAFFPDCFAVLHSFYTSPFGKIIAFLYTFALMHHLYGGVRHLLWDSKPCLLAKRRANILAWGTLALSLPTTLIIWLIGFFY